MGAKDAALDRPSDLGAAFLAEARGRTLTLHAMHSVVDWFAYAIWTPDSEMWRSLSLSPGSGIMENIGTPPAFEAPYWSGENPVEGDDGARVAGRPDKRVKMRNENSRSCGAGRRVGAGPGRVLLVHPGRLAVPGPVPGGSGAVRCRR